MNPISAGASRPLRVAWRDAIRFFHLTLHALALSVLVAMAHQVAAQSWPTGPVKIVVPSAPGTQTDVVARAIGQRLSPVLGQPVLIDNRPGADGMLAVEAVVNAPADGHTFANVQSGSLTLAPTLYPGRIRYDPEKDLAAVVYTTKTIFVFSVNAMASIRNIREFVDATRANPKTAALGHMPGVGLLGALVAKQTTQADVELIAYKGQPALWTDLLGGRILGAMEPLGGAFGQIRGGKLRPIALLSGSRSRLLPDLPTATEQGFPGMEVDGWNGLFARAGTSSAVIERMYRESRRILDAPDLREQFLGQGMEVEEGTPAQLAQRVRDDRAKWEKVIRAFGVKVEQ